MTLLNPDIWSGKLFTGTWSSSGETGTATDPATQAELGSWGMPSADDVRASAQSAARAQRDWAARPPSERAAVLRKAGMLFEEHAAEIEQWIVQESGAIAPKAQLETHIAAEECYEASALPTHPIGEVLSTDKPHWSIARRRAAGVVSVIAPFNFPLILSIRAVAPALALGNAVLLKPDPRTAVCGGVVLARIFEEAGLPEGLLHLLPGGAEIGQATITAPETRVVAFTGSTPAGRKIGALCAEHLKRAHLELGGNNAMVVLPGADIEKAVSAAAFGSFMHQGQICMTTGRHIIHEDIYDEYASALAEKADGIMVGRPSESGVMMGPIIDENQLKRVDSIVQDGLVQGAQLLAGGTHDGLFYRPTVLGNVASDNPAWCDEIFGPVAPLAPVSSVEEAVRLANDSQFGLSLSVLGPVSEAIAVADAFDSGIVHINESTVADEATAPFGGTKDSGNGSRHGGAAANIEAFTETQWLTVSGNIPPYPF
ncbi:benzaldehyde dehydrogenase [Nesterenkonia sp. NBAIMH1]|uniref:benzaldehyde dehydrogenase n=1 Tax=Nesterenkonia sp. NBAIMH1 TaxID=2600320 RepID=UPI0011B8330C|nr:benzaldehyde dehydrogenase [Nesterenkonia sp. NBAIMH1]